MSLMPRLALTLATMVILAFAIVGIAKAFGLEDGPYYPIAFIIGLLLVGLSDRDRFYGADIGREARRRAARPGPRP